MHSITRELKQVLRKLFKTPAFTIVAVLTLAVGIGANTAIFSVVEGILLRPLPYPESDRLVSLWHEAPGLDLPQFEQSNTTYTMYAEQARTLESVGLAGRAARTLTGSGEPVRLASATATASLFRVLRVTPVLGRTFSEAEDDPGGPSVVVLSHEIWTERFGADEGILGRTITLDNEAWEVIGVLPPEVDFPTAEAELWTPHVIAPEELGRTNFSYWGIGRLAPDVRLEAVEAELEQLLYRTPDVYPGEMTLAMMESANMGVIVRPMKEDVVGDVGRMLWILLGTVTFVLLIACANVANLFLVRAEGRQREMAVRTAMGAGRGDLIRGYLSESIMLSMVGGIVGIALAFVGVRALVAAGPQNLPRLGEIGIYGTVLLFTGGVSLISGFLFGLVPALKYGRPNLTIALKEGGRGGSVGRETHRANNVLVAAQVALALMLLVGSGLMMRSFFQLQRVDPGFDADNLLTLNLAMIPNEVESSEQAAAFFQQVLDNVEALPGVTGAGASTSLPLAGGWSNNAMVIEGRPLPDGGLPPIVRTNITAPGYFESMNIPVVEGRAIERRDHEQKTDVAVISQALADLYWPDSSPIGARVSPELPSMMEGDEWVTIVGVVGDVRDDGLTQEPPGMIYYPMVRETGWFGDIARLYLTLKTQSDPGAMLPAVRAEIWALDSRLPIANVQTGAELVSDASARTSFTLVMLGIASAVALLLGTVGVYGVISYIVSQRIREFGIRLAMGAEVSRIQRMVVGQGVRVAAIGVLVGLAGGLALTRLLQTLLFGVSATDPLTFAAVSLVLIGVSALAAYLPARRASSVDPAIALRHE